MMNSVCGQEIHTYIQRRPYLRDPYLSHCTLDTIILLLLLLFLVPPRLHHISPPPSPSFPVFPAQYIEIGQDTIETSPLSSCRSCVLEIAWPFSLFQARQHHHCADLCPGSVCLVRSSSTLPPPGFSIIVICLRDSSSGISPSLARPL